MFQKHKPFFIFYLLFFIFVLTGCQSSPRLFKTGQVLINNQIIKVEIARTKEEMIRGLAGREDLAENQGLLFIFPKLDYYQFWMKGMKFPLDIVWIGEEKIVDLTENALPAQGKNLPIFRPRLPSQYVLEVKSGSVRAYNWQIGDKVEIYFDK